MAINFLAVVVLLGIILLAAAGVAIYAFLHWIDRNKQ
jgi:hypothetical protein